jgi:hypothetical protein
MFKLDSVKDAALAAARAKEAAENLSKTTEDWKAKTTKTLNKHNEHCQAVLEIAQNSVNNRLQDGEEVEIMLTITNAAAFTQKNALGLNLQVADDGVAYIKIKLSDLQKMAGYTQLKPILTSLISTTGQICEGANTFNSQAMKDMIASGKEDVPTLPAFFGSNKIS